MSLIRKHGAVLQAWACLDLVVLVTKISLLWVTPNHSTRQLKREAYCTAYLLTALTCAEKWKRIGRISRWLNVLLSLVDLPKRWSNWSRLQRTMVSRSRHKRRTG